MPALWGRNGVDAFIAAQHKAKGLTPSAEADRRTLIRRLSLDLLGLPPTPEEVDAFVNDTAADAYEKLVENMLASPHYGERWARHWLDVARWAESEGYESNHPRNFAWRYRDWVVKAFDRDLPFADFIRAQIAGDEITPYSDDHLIATGFLAAARLSSNEEDRWRQKNDIYVDIVNATGTAFLGLTLQCCQCHNHRLDPIPTADYYRFQGFFLKGQPGNLPLKDRTLWDEYEGKKAPGYEEALAERDQLLETGRQRKFAEVRKGLSKPAVMVLGLPRERRTPDQEKLARETDLLFQFTIGQFENMLSAEERKRYNDRKQQVADMEKRMLERPQTFGFYSPITSPHKIEPLPMKGFYPLNFITKELAEARPYVLVSGDVHRPATALDVGWPAIFGPTPAYLPSPLRGEGPGVRGIAPKAAPILPGERPRLALAEWLASPKNPLTARVYVNRLWQWHFGRGLVATSGDFGLKGSSPTHPQLLDWLAGELQRTGSTKHLHRLLVLSSTYRQSSAAHAENIKRDPDNLAWWRWAPRRLEAEAVRDSLLVASGELERKLGGPSVADDDKSLRRALYLVQKRDLAPKQQALFDGPAAMTESCTRRQTTTVPLQSLYLLNSDFSVQRGKALAKRVLSWAGTDRERQIVAAFRFTLTRMPHDSERLIARRFFDTVGGDSDAALVRFCQALLNVNEFVYIE